MKERILQTIYARFEEWSDSSSYACRKGCAACCTLNVQITALEGKRILDHCRRQKDSGWLQAHLAGVQSPPSPDQTSNEYVGNPSQDHPSTSPSQTGPCPFLEENRCTIYAVRPFSCRCFFSTTICTNRRAATVTDTHLYGALAAQQLIEHLGQFDLWGNMIDVLRLLEHRQSNGSGQTSERVRRILNNLRLAQPLPGFCYPESEQQRIGPLLHSILTSRIDGKTIEDVLNGK